MASGYHGGQGTHTVSQRGLGRIEFQLPMWSPLMNIPRAGFAFFLPYVPTPPCFLGLPMVMAGSMRHFDWAKGCQIPSKTLCPGMSVRVFPEEMSI